MTHITTWIVTLTLSGSPIPAALCATVCGHASTPTAHCHEGLSETASAAISAETICATVSTDSPYVKEDVSGPQVATVAAATSTPPVLASPTHRARFPRAQAVTAWLAPPLILRI